MRNGEWVVYSSWFFELRFLKNSIRSLCAVGCKVTPGSSKILRALPATDANPQTAPSIQALEQAHGEVLKWTRGEPPAEALNEIPVALPKFIYFTRYGSLESSVRLDQYQQNKDRGDLPKPDRERNRTITALFRFTGIDPGQLRSMAGSDANQMDLRQIKLTSGASKLTKEFNAWWKQHETEYIFRFTLDHDYFRIWVEDQRSKVPIELENRSAGFQWFLGFFVTFLVESEDAHRNTILLSASAWIRPVESVCAIVETPG